MDHRKEHDFNGPLGECKGCGRHVEECMSHRYCTPQPFEDMTQLLGCLAQFMDAVKPDLGPDWSEHDQAMRDAITRHLRKLTTPKQSIGGDIRHRATS